MAAPEVLRPQAGIHPRVDALPEMTFEQIQSELSDLRTRVNGKRREFYWLLTDANEQWHTMAKQQEIETYQRTTFKVFTCLSALSGIAAAGALAAPSIFNLAAHPYFKIEQGVNAAYNSIISAEKLISAGKQYYDNSIQGERTKTSLEAEQSRTRMDRAMQDERTARDEAEKAHNDYLQYLQRMEQLAARIAQG